MLYNGLYLVYTRGLLTELCVSVCALLTELCVSVCALLTA